MTGHLASTGEAQALASQLQELADRLRIAADPESDVAAEVACRRVADKLTTLASGFSLQLGKVEAPQPSIVHMVRERFHLPNNRTAQLLIYLMNRPDEVNSFAELNGMLGVRAAGSQVLKVYVSLTRSALDKVGLRDVLRNEWGEGYYIESPAVARIQRYWDNSLRDRSLPAGKKTVAGLKRSSRLRIKTKG